MIEANFYDCVIAGSGPAGMTAALYMCRAGYKTCLIMGEEHYGSLGSISKIENYPGIDDISGFELAKLMDKQLSKFEGKYLTKIEYTNVNNFSINDKIISIILDDDTLIFGKTFIEAIGGKHNVLGLENEELFFGSGISFCATCDGPMFNGKNVAIIGGGNSAMDFALTLSNYCKSVDIIHRRDMFRADEIMLEKVEKLKNVKFIMNTNVIKILGDSNFSGLLLKNNKENTYNEVFYDGCFYALGFNKNSISKNNTLNNNENIFSAGDCIDEKYRQVITAAGDGCKAALDCIKFLQSLEDKK
jgi:thioredoxin reductase (NADPH)